MNWKKLLLLALVLSAFTATNLFAVEGGNARKGKHLFKKNCKICHNNGDQGGELTPMSKTMSQWDRFFTKGKHSGEVLNKLTEKDLKDINQFLFDKAADSPSPATCG